MTNTKVNLLSLQTWVTNDHLDAYEKALSDDQEPPSLAKSVLVSMVRELFTKLQFAYAQFPVTQ